jgi:ubiquitin carboxyl-terminal hydrolase 25
VVSVCGHPCTDRSAVLGKTAPRLLRDLLDYDPKTEPLIGRNTLASSPPQDLNTSAVPVLPEEGCIHNFAERLEPDDVLPAQDTRPGPTSAYEVHATCRHCRVHLDLYIEYRDGHQQSGGDFFACPNKEYPLHHFQLIKEGRVPPRYYAGSEQERDAVAQDSELVFRCSAPQCLAKVAINLRSPRLSDGLARLITDHGLLQQRLAAAVAIDPTRTDLEMSLPPTNYELLCIFLTHALDTSRERKTIKFGNRRFLTCFGEDCNPLLQALGFTLLEEDGEAAWALPDASKHSDPGAFAAFLNDVRNELSALFFGRPERERVAIKRISSSPIPSGVPRAMQLEISRCLGYSTYDKVFAARRTTYESEELLA